MMDTKLRLNPPYGPPSGSPFEFAPAGRRKTRSAPHTQAKRSLELSFGGIRRQHGSREFVAIGEHQFFHLHPSLTVSGGCADNGDLVARFEGTPAPASPRQKIRTREFTLPFDGLAAVVFHGESEQCVRIDILEFGHGRAHGYDLRHVVFRSAVVRP